MPGLIGEYLPQILMFGGLAVGGLLLMRARQSFRFSRDSDEESQQRSAKDRSALANLLSGAGRDQAFSDAPPELLRWQVEMHETARDLKAEIDTKLISLQAIISLARDERARLEEVISRGRKVGCSQQADPLLTIEQLGGASLAQVNQLLDSLPGLAAGEKGDPAAIYEKRQAAQALSASGLSHEMIGKRLDLPTTDVEFLLGVCPPAKKSS